MFISETHCYTSYIYLCDSNNNKGVILYQSYTILDLYK